jgi:NAD(P)-dependent dehydrogenase (short-subunit alcohol dehydrogenase family)
MRLEGLSAAVTGGASGLGRATAEKLSQAGAAVTIIDLPASQGKEVAHDLAHAQFVPADVTQPDQVSDALDQASTQGELRAVVHCAGHGRKMRILDRDGNPGSLEDFEAIVQLNLVGSFNVMRLAAARMAQVELVDGERGVVVLTASSAAFEGQIGQVNYAASKAGIVGMTLTAARDLASRGIRVCTIAPGIMNTPAMARVRPDLLDSLAASVPNPPRLGNPNEFAMLAAHIIENGYLNGETLRLDGAIRMAPR